MPGEEETIVKAKLAVSPNNPQGKPMVSRRSRCDADSTPIPVTACVLLSVRDPCKQPVEVSRPGATPQDLDGTPEVVLKEIMIDGKKLEVRRHASCPQASRCSQVRLHVNQEAQDSAALSSQESAYKRTEKGGLTILSLPQVNSARLLRAIVQRQTAFPCAGATLSATHL